MSEWIKRRECVGEKSEGRASRVRWSEGRREGLGKSIKIKTLP